MNFADLALRNRTVTLVLTAVLLGAGLSSFQGLSRLEDPEFTIKDALVITPYPGATAAEVEEEVSDEIELAAQQLGQLKRVTSKSDRGLSTVTVTIKDQYDKTRLPQVWDELRRKVSDAQGNLPPGAGPSIVVDDFGDVYGIFVAIYGPEFSESELKEFAKAVRRELLLVQDVAKVEFWGERTEAIYIEPNRERMSQLGVNRQAMIDELRDRSLVSDAGRVEVGREYIAVNASGTFTTVQAFEELLISGGSGQQIRLRDVADVRRGYVEPPQKILRYDGNVAIGLGISTVSGGNVVVMGEAIEARLRELLAQIPLGIEFGIISLQSLAVTQAIGNFTMSLLQAVAIVVVVLLLFMGLRSGLLIGFILLVTIIGTFIFMGPWNVALERISLGALIIALGMLVDNAIVVVDGMLVRMGHGEDPEEAAKAVVGQTATPLLGATAVAIMAFAAIGTSDDSTGEFCRSLFQVVLISLGLSWVTAVTVTPVLGVMFLKVDPPKEGEASDPYDTGFYNAYKSFLAACIGKRWLTVGAVLGLFAVSLWGFRFVDQSFFPDSTRPQFLVDLWLPQGTHISDTERVVGEAEQYLIGLDPTTHVTSLVGAGGMRFLLTYAPEKSNSSYAQFLVDVDDYTKIAELIPTVERGLMDAHPDSLVYGRRIILGPGDGGKIQVRLSGNDPDELRRIESQVTGILHDDPGAKAIRSDWNQRVKVIDAVVADEEANRAGVTPDDVATAVKAGFQGVGVGYFRERDELLPVFLRSPAPERANVTQLSDLQIWSPTAGRTIPITQVVERFEPGFEDEIVWRRNRKPTITIHADPTSGPASIVLGRVMPKIEALELPTGYAIEWGGEYQSSGDAQAALAGNLPVFFGAMVLIVIVLFNGLKQPAVIFLCVPLALIGVTGGLLATGQPFGFMALLGFLSLTGMLIKNAIVLIDEMEIQKAGGLSVYDAILTSGVSRLRPVAMAALTTALGMIPLLPDAFFVAMAVTIIGGLVVATVLTMVVVPVLYAIFFGAEAP